MRLGRGTCPERQKCPASAEAGAGQRHGQSRDYFTFTAFFFPFRRFHRGPATQVEL